jgi:hypothetical protein
MLGRFAPFDAGENRTMRAKSLPIVVFFSCLFCEFAVSDQDQNCNFLREHVSVSEALSYRISYFRLLIGEVTLCFSEERHPLAENSQGLVDPIAQRRTKCRLENSCLDSFEASPSGVGSPHTESRFREAPIWTPSPPRVIGLWVQTRGAVNWLKDYKGNYRSLANEGGFHYRVDASDRGVPEYREILFYNGKSRTGIPQVRGFLDRVTKEGLEPDAVLDIGSKDPIQALEGILSELAVRQGCPSKPIEYKVFDGKRRYRVVLQSGSKGSASSNQLDVSIHSEVCGAREHYVTDDQIAKPSSEDCVVQRNARGDLGVLPKNTLQGGGLTPAKKKSDNADLKNEANSVAFTSKQKPPKKSVNHARKFSCNVLLTGFEASLDTRGKDGGRDRENNVHSAQDSRVESEQPFLFWPFNKESLTIELEILQIRNRTYLEKILVEAPLGMLRGELRKVPE